MKVSSNSKITLLATVIISFVVCAIVCVGIAFGSPPENRMLQELSSFVMEMLLFFVIWVQITSSTNTVLRHTRLYIQL